MGQLQLTIYAKWYNLSDFSKNLEKSKYDARCTWKIKCIEILDCCTPKDNWSLCYEHTGKHVVKTELARSAILDFFFSHGIKSTDFSALLLSYLSLRFSHLTIWVLSWSEQCMFKAKTASTLQSWYACSSCMQLCNIDFDRCALIIMSGSHVHGN